MIRLSRNTAPLLKVVDNQPNPRLQVSRQSSQSPDPDRSPVSTDDEGSVGPAVPSSYRQEASDDEFPTIDDEEAAASASFQSHSNGRSYPRDVKQSPRFKDVIPSASVASRSPASGGAKRKSHIPVPDADPWTVADEKDSNRIFSFGSSQQKRMYSRHKTSSQPTTQLHAQAFRRAAVVSSQTSDNGAVRFQAPPVLSLGTNSLKPGFIQPTDLSLDHKSKPTEAFKAPPTLDDITIDLLDDNDSGSSPLSSPPSTTSSSSIMNYLQDSQLPQEPTFTPPTTISSMDLPSTTVPCSMCKQPVDRSFYESFCDGKRLKSREALRFCKTHQKRAAEDKWISAHYPDIDWDNLDKRLRKFNTTVSAFIEKRQPSVYRQQLDEYTGAGRSSKVLRNYLASDAAHSVPGYYGSRGAQVIVEHIMAGFGGKLREHLTRDAVFKAVGAGGYVQAVLMPEIACLLVMEDMDVDFQRAREVLTESIEIGELLNPEVEERIEPEDEEENEEGLNGIEEGQALEDENNDASPTQRKKVMKKRRKDIEVVDID